MATDKSEPKIGMIAKVGVLAIATLIGTHEGLVAYFDHVAQAEEYRKVGSLKPEALMSVRADEKQRLETGPMPIQKAMQMLETKGRMSASPDIMPSASKDVAPLQGWSKLPAQVPAPMMAPAPAPSSSAEPSPAASSSAAPAAGSASAAPGSAPAPKQPKQPQPKQPKQP